MSLATANRKSAGVRFDRAMSRAFVRRGGSLTLLLRDGRRIELEGVRVATLVRWVRGIGAQKANRVLLGLPHYYRLRELDAEQRDQFVQRLAAAETHLITRQIYQEES